MKDWVFTSGVPSRWVTEVEFLVKRSSRPPPFVSLETTPKRHEKLSRRQ
jgi:hypothetical protein